MRELTQVEEEEEEEEERGVQTRKHAETSLQPLRAIVLFTVRPVSEYVVDLGHYVGRHLG